MDASSGIPAISNCRIRLVNAMASNRNLKKLVSDALEILQAFGIPLERETQLRKMRIAKAFLAVAGMKPGLSWAEAKSNDDNHRLRSRDVLQWMNLHLGENISSGSYDDIRRKDLVLPVTAGVILKSAGKSDAATNDGTRAYAIDQNFAAQICLFGTPAWDTSLAKFMAGKLTLAELLRKQRELARIPVKIGGQDVLFSPGEHNQLQKAIVEQFLPLFGRGAEVLYVGDTERKSLFLDEQGLRKLEFFELSHDKLPDVLAYSSFENWLYLIEAVHSANPISELRKLTLERLATSCTADIVFVTAFLNRDTFRKFSADIAWETEVWIADNPEHLIHFNGDKFLGPHKSPSSVTTEDKEPDKEA